MCLSHLYIDIEILARTIYLIYSLCNEMGSRWVPEFAPGKMAAGPRRVEAWPLLAPRARHLRRSPARRASQASCWGHWKSDMVTSLLTFHCRTGRRPRCLHRGRRPSSSSQVDFEVNLSVTMLFLSTIETTMSLTSPHISQLQAQGCHPKLHVAMLERIRLHGSSCSEPGKRLGRECKCIKISLVRLSI